MFIDPHGKGQGNRLSPAQKSVATQGPGRNNQVVTTHVQNGLLALGKTPGILPALHLSLALAGGWSSAARAEGDLLQRLRGLPLRHGTTERRRVAGRRAGIIVRLLCMGVRRKHLVLRGRVRRAAVGRTIRVRLEGTAEIGGRS